MNDLEVMEKSLFSQHAKVTKTSLQLSEGLTYKDWEHIGKILQNMNGAIHWWLGDWLKYGEGNYGEKYAQAIEETGFDYGTLANDVYTCKAIDFSRRHEKLTFSHHAEVASLEPKEQDKWLDKAEKDELSVKELREMAKGTHKENKEDEITCPFCKKRFVPNE